MFVNPGFEGLKIVSARKDGGREGVPIVVFNNLNIKLRFDTLIDFWARGSQKLVTHALTTK